MTEQPPNYPPPPGGYGYQPPPPGGYGSPWPGSGYPPPPPSVGTNGFAIASLVSSVLGWICIIGPILGLIFGFVALNQIKKTGQSGRGMALAGVIIGGIWVALVLVYVVVLIIFAATHSGESSSSAALITIGQQAFSQAVLA